jgi:hypothetical protein
MHYTNILIDWLCFLEESSVSGPAASINPLKRKKGRTKIRKETRATEPQEVNATNPLVHGGYGKKPPVQLGESSLSFNDDE